MRERMERLVVLPFSIGCVSQSSVAVGENNPKKTKPDANPPSTRGVFLSGGKTKNSNGLPMKSNFTAGFHRLKKGFKSFSQIFVYKEEEMEEMEMEMEIGLPTDVKHVTHIGWDGSTTTMKSWDDFKAPDFLTLPSISLRQFELAMAAQVDEPNDNGSSLRFT